MLILDLPSLTGRPRGQKDHVLLSCVARHPRVPLTVVRRSRSDG